MAGRELPPTSRFAADDGAADPALAEALARFAGGAGRLADVVDALARARVLVPVLALEHEDADDAMTDEDARVTEDEASTPFAESRRASAGVVAVATPDGRTALPVFSSVGTLVAWHPTARPMPAEGPRAAAAAVGEGWDLMVLDPAGDAPVVVPRPAVHALASGSRWEPAVEAGRVTPGVRAAVRGAAAGPGVLEVDVVPGRQAEVAVVLTLAGGLSRAGLAAVLREVGARLGADAEVTARVDSLELRAVGPAGHGPTAEPAGGSAAPAAVVSDGADAAPVPARARRWRRAPGRR